MTTMQESVISTNCNAFWSRGYVRFTLSKQIMDPSLKSDMAALLKSYDALPPDPYDETQTRHRTYSRCILMPWNENLEWIPEVGGNGSKYFQGSHNPEHQGQHRDFSPISSEIRNNNVVRLSLRHIVKSIYSSEHVKHDRPYHIGVHQVSQRVNEEKDVAAVTPNCMHQDGELFDFAILINRENVSGGENCIADRKAVGMAVDDVPDELVHTRFSMTDPLDGFGVVDSMVSHGVSPVKLSIADRTGRRDTLLVDVVPLVAQVR